MINYSIVMRSVNANLLAINQAKSRINQAKKEGKEPEKEDLELVKTEKQNAFAVSQYTDIVTIEKFAKHITSHGSVYSRADISAILYMAVDCMREMRREFRHRRRWWSDGPLVLKLLPLQGVLRQHKLFNLLNSKDYEERHMEDGVADSHQHLDGNRNHTRNH